MSGTDGTQKICVPDVQGSTNRRAPGFVNFVLALAYHFCLNLPAAFTQPGARLLVEPCTSYILCSVHSLYFFFSKTHITYHIQGSTNRRAPGCENAAGKLRQKW